MSIFDFRIQKILDDGDDAGVLFQLADGGTVGMELACIEHHGIGRPRTACGFECNADHNAALNILAAGQAVSACGAGRAQAPASKQEPACGAAR